MSSKQSETPRRGVGTDIGGGKWTISNTTKGITGCNCALFQSTCKTPISGKHCLRRASGKIQTLGAFTGTASSTTWQMEKMRRAFSPLYESLLPPPALRECLHDLLARRGVAVWARDLAKEKPPRTGRPTPSASAASRPAAALALRAATRQPRRREA